MIKRKLVSIQREWNGSQEVWYGVADDGTIWECWYKWVPKTNGYTWVWMQILNIPELP